MSVLCDSGPSDSFRVIAHCESGISSWIDYGTFGHVGSDSSQAQCQSLIGMAHVGGYHIDWL
ncbi:hypothetical protein JOF56_003488 [Kibdelosporangium banguiense]|uniref:Uncharacterized protein n=1 Tax=Kibdelosporangium banguiense TaxID=1365924 RepID=A0ABS4TFA1_9PSEU|nr:hypothetical protein [Kibdelosporangium banguiense]MBP2323103.1 hypothetical protein [Kibdelosporangium banguiense]